MEGAVSIPLSEPQFCISHFPSTSQIHGYILILSTTSEGRDYALGNLWFWKESMETLLCGFGEEEGIGGEMWVGRGTQRQNLASVINWFHEAEPDPREGQDCLPLPFFQKRKHVRTSWEER